MGKYIRFDSAARRALWRGVDQLASAVRVTLGPRGRGVVLEQLGGAPTITNDGLAISRAIELEDPFENMGVRLLREVAIKTGEVAGDGTTTATVLAHRVVGAGLEAIEAGHNPMAVKRGIERSVTAVVEALAGTARQIAGRADLERVATVSANGDAETGGLIAEAMDRVGRHGVLLVEEGRATTTTLEVTEGVRLDRGYLSPYFVNEPDSMEVALNHALVLVVDGRLAVLQDVVPAMELAAAAGRPLAVIAAEIEGEALATLVVNRLRGAVQSVAIRAPGVGEARREQLEDLAVLTGAQLQASDRGSRLDRFEAADFGSAQRIVVDREHTTLIGGGGRPEEIRARIGRLERELASGGPEREVADARERLARLAGRIAVIRVGAATQLALRERRSRVEDALAATRSAVEEGVVTGGGVALLRAAGALRALDLPGDERVGRTIVLAALDEPIRQIARNAGEDGSVAAARVHALEGPYGFNAMTREFEDLDRAGILDPAKVTRCALQHAASIGSLVLTTDAIVVEGPETEGPAETPPEG